MQINKGQFRISSRWERLRFNLLRGKGHLLAYLLNRLRWYYYPRFSYAGSFPNHVDVETSSACDMRCPMCYTVTEEFKKLVKPRLMRFELFKKIVDECAQNGVYSLRVSLRGEPFLHPQIVEMIRYAKARGIPEVASLTNGLRLTTDQFAELVEIGMDWLTISFDGMGETYERVRKPARFEEMVAKIRQFGQIKRRRGRPKPVLKVQSVWTYIQDAPQEFYELFRPLVDEVASNPEIDFNDRESGVEYLEDFTCPTLWQRLVVGADGRVLMCINDEYGKHPVGDLNHQTIAEVWKGEALQKVREAHLRKAGHRELTPCKTCIYPRKVRKVESAVAGRSLDNYAYDTRPEALQAR
jgi:radical SAM protein with 4Fe4S-binding SPASM domain